MFTSSLQDSGKITATPLLNNRLQIKLILSSQAAQLLELLSLSDWQVLLDVISG